MTTDLQKAVAHTILPVERLGDTLVMTPHGDVGSYSQQAFQAEFMRVKSVLKDPTLKNLIIDLGGSRYFGSEMIGALVALREQMIERGRIALVEVSRDTLVGLQTVKADALFEIIGTRSAAVRQIATLSVGERLGRYRRPLTALACLLLIAAVVWVGYELRLGYKVFGSRTARTYDAIVHEWNRWERGQGRWAAEEARTYRSQIESELKSLDDSIRERHLYTVEEDYWLIQSIAYFRHVLEGEDYQRDEFARAMGYARTCIERRTGIPVKKVELSKTDVKKEGAASEQAADSSPSAAGEPTTGAIRAAERATSDAARDQLTAPDPADASTDPAHAQPVP